MAPVCKARRAHTLVEVLSVLVVAVILASTAAPTVTRASLNVTVTGSGDAASYSMCAQHSGSDNGWEVDSDTGTIEINRAGCP